ncbi:MAG: DUF3849 domain-containing protein [Clostridia bacterium]
MKNAKPMYRNSFSEAKRADELSYWQESLDENVRCRDFIQKTVEDNFKDNHLKSISAREIIEEFGYHRTAFVMANSVLLKPSDGRFSRVNKDWAKSFKSYDTKDITCKFQVDTHSALFDGLINQFKREYAKLELIDSSKIDFDCQDFTGKVIAVKPQSLAEKYLNQQDQIYLATSGFGCEPDKIGRAVFATCLGDGEKVRWDRSQILGVIKDECIPDWATQKLTELGYKQTEQNQEYEIQQSM